jgi:co-chaperonin GroES (HSP10)
MKALGYHILLTRVKETDETGSGLILGKSNDYEVLSIGEKTTFDVSVGDTVRIAPDASYEGGYDMGNGIIAVKEYDLVAVV